MCTILFFGFLLFFSPGYSAAVFSDSVSTDAGIKLTLGNLQVTESTSFLNKEVTVASDNLDQTIFTTMLTNTGTLMGKLGYRIESDIPSDLKDDIIFSLYEGDLYIADLDLSESYLFLHQDTEDIVFEPGSQKSYSIKINTNTLPSETEDFQITFSFILSQTNADEPEQMFHDEVDFEPIAITLEKENTEPEIVWPADTDSRWMTDKKSNITYISELDTKTMYYSETSDGSNIRNLDNLSIYIDYSGTEKPTFSGLDTVDSPFKITIVTISNDKIRIDFSIDTTVKGNENQTTIIDYWYDISVINTRISFDGELAAKRLLLTTDQADHDNNGSYQADLFPLYVSNSPLEFGLAYIKNNNYGQLSSLIETDILFNAYHIDFVATEANAFVTNINADNNSFITQLNGSGSHSEGAKKLSILITGNASNELKIERRIIPLKVDPSMTIPSKWQNIGSGIRVNAQQITVPVIKTSEGDRAYYVNDPSQMFVLYFKNKDENYFGFSFNNQLQESDGFKAEEVAYSADLTVMRVTFSFASESLSHWGFAYYIHNGINSFSYSQANITLVESNAKYISANRSAFVQEESLLVTEETVSIINSEMVESNEAVLVDSAEKGESFEMFIVDEGQLPSATPPTEADSSVIATESPQPTTP